MLTAFFWLPALLEMPLVQLDRIHSEAVSYRNWFLTWPGGRVAGWHGDMAFRQLTGGSLWTSAEVTVERDEPGVLAFHQLAFAGWLAIAGWLFIAARRSTGRRQLALGSGGLVIALGVIVVSARLMLPLWPPPTEQPQQRIVTNVIEDVLAGRAIVHAPTGAALGPDRFLDVRYLSVLAQDRPLRDGGSRSRRWLKMHPPAAVAVELTLPDDAYFQTGIVLDPAMWAAPLGDGVRFVATITPAGGTETTLFDIPNHPRGQGEHRRWIDVVADLRPWAGQHVQLTLRTDGRQDPANDWAGWGEPVIVQLDPLTGARLLQSSARIQEVTFRP